MKEWDAWEDWEASEWDVDCSPAEAVAVSDDDDMPGLESVTDDDMTGLEETNLAE